MAQLLGTIVADFQTQLATAIEIGGTTATLQSATDDDGTSLPAGRYFFTIDGDNTAKEHISCELSGTSLTSIKTVIRQGTETSGVVRKHRVGATVTITNFKHIKAINDLLDGTTDFDASTPLKYDGTASITDDDAFATKAYVDGVAIAGAADASTSTKGISKMSVAPASPTEPIAVGDNDPRVPTTDENDALAGTSGSPSSSNKYVTEDDVTEAKTASKIARRDSNSDILVATTPTAGDAASSKTYVDARTTHFLYTVDTITPTNDTSENTVFSTTISADTLGTSGGIFIRIPVYISAPTSTACTYTVRLKLGGSTVATTTVTCGAIGGGSGNAGYGEFTGTILADGATNDQDVFAGFTIGGLAGQNVQIPYVASVQSTTAAVDMTSSQTLEVTQQKSSTATQMTYHLGHVTVLNN